MSIFSYRSILTWLFLKSFELDKEEIEFGWLVRRGGGAGGIVSSGLGKAGADFRLLDPLVSSSKMQLSGKGRSSPSTYTWVLNLTRTFCFTLGVLGFLSRLTRTVDTGRRKGWGKFAVVLEISGGSSDTVGVSGGSGVGVVLRCDRREKPSGQIGAMWIPLRRRALAGPLNTGGSRNTRFLLSRRASWIYKEKKFLAY